MVRIWVFPTEILVFQIMTNIMDDLRRPRIVVLVDDPNDCDVTSPSRFDPVMLAVASNQHQGSW